MKELFFNRRRKKEEETKKAMIGAFMKAFDRSRPQLVYGANPSGIRKVPVESPKEIEEAPTEIPTNIQPQHDLDASEVADLDPYGVRK